MTTNDNYLYSISGYFCNDQPIGLGLEFKGTREQMAVIFHMICDIAADLRAKGVSAASWVRVLEGMSAEGRTRELQFPEQIAALATIFHLEECGVLKSDNYNGMSYTRRASLRDGGSTVH